MRNIRNFKQAAEFLAYVESLGVSLPFDEDDADPAPTRRSRSR